MKHPYYKNTRLRVNKYKAIHGKVKASELGTKEEVDKIKMILKLFKGTIVGIYEPIG